MRRRIALVIALCMLVTLALCGCSRPKDNSLIKVVTTIFAPYDFVRQVAGDAVSLTMLFKPGGEAHSYEPTPQDIITIRNCDVFICAGGENDEWVMDILDSVDNPNIKIIKMIDCVELYEEEIVPGMDTGHATSSDEEEWDEHVWTNPANAAIISGVICDVLTELDGTNASLYKANLARFTAELDGLNQEFLNVMKAATKNTLFFGDRFPLKYFTEAYGLKYYAAFPGCAQETEASAATIAFLIDEARKSNVKVIFKIELTSDNMARTIASECQAVVRTFYTCHNVSREDFAGGETYVSLMRRNIDTLKEALN